MPANDEIETIKDDSYIVVSDDNMYNSGNNDDDVCLGGG